MLNAATAMISVRMMNITRFSIATARKKRMRHRPVAYPGVHRERACQIARHLGRGEHVVELQPHARHTLHAVEPARIVDADEC